MLSIATIALTLYSAFQTHPGATAHAAPTPAFSNQELGFSFTPPTSLRDLTALAREAELNHPASPG